MLLVQWLEAYIDEYGRGGVVKITTSDIGKLVIPHVIDSRDEHRTVISSVSRAWRKLMSGGGFNTKTHRYAIQPGWTDSRRRVWVITRTNNP